MCELRKGKLSSFVLIRCDYNLADRANALGLPGKQEYGWEYLRQERLGSERLSCSEEQKGSEYLTWVDGFL